MLVPLVLLLVLVLVPPCTSSYRAAVVEFTPQSLYSPTSPVSRQAAQGVILANLDAMYSAASLAAADGAQLVVFPEDGLYDANFFTRAALRPYLIAFPEPDNTTTYCFSSPASPLQAMACLAARLNLTAVFNAGHLESCVDPQHPWHAQCPEDGAFQFNTQLAFDPRGRLIGRYFKTHLFPDDLKSFDYPPQQAQPELVYFDTDFGVRFGMMICFDIFFDRPATALRRADLGVTDFVFSTFFVNYALNPLMSATQLQQAFARAQGSNFVASNVGFGGDYSGSGIFSAGGEPLVTEYSYSNKTAHITVLVADVGDVGSRPRFTSRHTTELALVPTDFEPDTPHPRQPIYGGPDETGQPTSASWYKFTSKDHTTVEAKASKGNVSCFASITFGQVPASGLETFALVAVDGGFSNLGSLLDARLCAVVFCPNDDCSRISTEPTSEVASITLEGQFPPSYLVMPMVGGLQGQLFPASHFSVTSDSSTTRLSSNTPINAPIANAVLYGQHSCSPSSPSTANCITHL